MAILKSDIQSPQHYFTLFKPKYYHIGKIWGRKSNVVRLRGEENQRTRAGERRQTAAVVIVATVVFVVIEVIVVVAADFVVVVEVVRRID